MYSVSSKDTKRYHLRLLLLHTPGACSFEDLKKVNDEICPTFADAAKKRGLLCDDTEYGRCLAEAALFQMPSQLRTLFCVILLYCNPRSPIGLRNSFKTNMAEDFMRHFDVETTEAKFFYEIEAKLTEQGRSFSDFAIPRPSVSCRLASENINQEAELRFGKEMYQTLHEDQRLAANERAWSEIINFPARWK
jgi:hypothetical protein